MPRAASLLIAALAVLIAAAPAGAAPKPKFGKTAVLKRVSGVVTVKERGAKRARRIRRTRRVRMPARVSATDGRVTVRTRLPNGKGQAATFNGAPFVLSQPKRETGLTELKLDQKLQCGSGAARSARRSRLFGRGHGRFRTRGRNSSATVRGTTWVTEDKCAGTEITSVKGEVKTDARGADLSRLLKPGQTVTYFCNVEGTTEPLPGTYCSLVLSQPADGIVGMGFIAITDETRYQLCLFYPDGTPDCGDLPLSEPHKFGFRQSAVACAVPQDGVYTVRWGLQNRALFPDLTTPPIKGTGTGYCQQQTEPTEETPSGASLRAGPAAGAGHALERAAR